MGQRKIYGPIRYEERSNDFVRSGPQRKLRSKKNKAQHKEKFEMERKAFTLHLLGKKEIKNLHKMENGNKKKEICFRLGYLGYFIDSKK